MAYQKQAVTLSKGWLIWAVASLFVFYQFLLQNSPGIMSHSLMDAFSITAEGVGFLSSSFFYTYLILQIPAGLVVDWLGARRLLVVGPAACGVAAVLFALTSSFSIAFVSRMLMGLVTAPAVASVMYLSMQYLPARLFGMAAGLTEMMGMIGGINEASLGHFVQAYGWRLTVIGCAALGLFLALLMGLVIPSGDNTAMVEDNNQTRYSMTDKLIAVLKQPQAWINGLLAGLTFSLVTAFAGLWCVPYLETLYPITEATASYGSAMIFLGVAIGAPILGALGGRAYSLKAFLSSLLLVELALLLAVIYYPPANFSAMLGLLFITGFMSGVYIVPFSLVQYFAPPYAQATSFGFMNMMLIIVGAPILQPLTGAILHWYSGADQFKAQDFQVALLSLIGSFVLAMLLIVALRLPKARQSEVIT